MVRLQNASQGWLALAAGVALLAPPAAVRAFQPARANPADPDLRVLLLQDTLVRVRPAASSAGLRVLDGQGRLLQSLGSAELLQLDPSALPPGRELWLEAVGTPAEPDPGLWLQQRRYRGRLQVRLEGAQLQVVNHVPLETYLTSVVGSEMPASWPQEALRAQAVAARTYALKTRKPAGIFDLRATTASQVYKGVEAETPSTLAAVQGTRGQVLTYNDALIEAVFHSSSGGSTESSGDLWAKQLPYLVSVPDFDQASPVREWRQPLDRQQLRKAFPELGEVQAIEVLRSTPTGRVREARVQGGQGQLLLSGAQLRQRLGLKSTWVRFEQASPAAVPVPVRLEGLAFLVLPPPPLPSSQQLPSSQPLLTQPLQLVAVGRGFGHGIGMSQWGALAMAQRGESYAAILSHYYRGAQLRTYSDLAGTSVAAGGL